jgi:hypothetical protein
MPTRYIYVESSFVEVSEEHIASIFRVQDIQEGSDTLSASDRRLRSVSSIPRMEAAPTGQLGVTYRKEYPS